MRRESRKLAAARANRHWNAQVLDQTIPLASFDPEFAETITHLHTAADTDSIDPTFADDLLARLLDSPPTVEELRANAAHSRRHRGRVTAIPVTPKASPNGHHPLPFPTHLPPSSGRRSLRPWLQWTAAFAVLAILAGAILPWRSFGIFQTADAPPDQTVAAPTFADPLAVRNGDATYRGDAGRTGTMPGPGPVGSPSLVWKNQSGLYHDSPPIVAGNRLFVVRGGLDGSSTELAALDLGTGLDLWTQPLDIQSTGNIPVAANGLVIVPNTGNPEPGSLVAFSQDSGQQVWTYEFDAVFTAPTPAVAEGFLYFTMGDFTLRAVNVETGIEAWRVRVPPLTEEETQFLEGFGTEASVSVADGVVYSVGSDGVVFAADAANGDELWTFQTEGHHQDTPVYADGLVFATSSVSAEGPAGTPGRLYAIDARTGEERWSETALPSSVTVTAGNGALYLQVNDLDRSYVESRNVQSGDLIWTFEGGGYLDYPALAGDHLYLRSGDGVMVAVDAATGLADWSVYLDAGDPIVVNGMVIASGYDTLYAVGGSRAAQTADAAPVDLSGLAPCTPPRPAPAAPLTGEPERTIYAETQLIDRHQGEGTDQDGRIWPGERFDWPQILYENLPTGPSADPDVVEAIRTTLRQINDCATRPETGRQIQGFFTDDFFRRGIVPSDEGGYVYTFGIDVEEEHIDDFWTVALDDGRVAVMYGSAEHPIGPIIFAEQDGRWLIDEYYMAVPYYIDYYG